MISTYFSHKRNLVLPIAFIGGALFNKWMHYLTFLSPYLIFCMLFITYCKLTLHEIRPGKFEIKLLITQLLLAGIVFIAIYFINPEVAKGTFICIFVPTATAAPVITYMLGGSISKVVSYLFVSNFAVAILGPIILAAIGDNEGITFGESFVLILSQVAPLLIGPIICALALGKVFPKLHETIGNHQQLSFYFWAVSLFIIVGGCVSFAINTWTVEKTGEMIFLGIGALGACLIQFYVGRKMGENSGEGSQKRIYMISAGQALMQKNTVLAVWLAMAYMNPITSLGPACYIAWQNILNSWQLMKHDSLEGFGKVS